MTSIREGALIDLTIVILKYVKSWADIMQGLQNSHPRTKLKFVEANAHQLRSVQRQSQRIQRYFLHDLVRDAA
jgi:hypothetical protein